MADKAALLEIWGVFDSWIVTAVEIRNGLLRLIPGIRNSSKGLFEYANFNYRYLLPLSDE